MRAQIQRVKPQRKRKALSAKAFADRYCCQAIEAAESGNDDQADDLYAKSIYWRERYEMLVERGAFL